MGQFAKSGAIHETDVEDFVAFTRPESMRRAWAAQETASLIYRRQESEAFRWHLMELLPSRSGTDPRQSAILSIRDIHAPLTRLLSPQNTEAEHSNKWDMQMAAILKSRFKILTAVDPDSGQCQRIDLTRPAGAQNVLTGEYDRFIQNAVSRYVLPEDAQSYLAVLSRDHLREQSAKLEGDYKEEVCLYRQQGESPRWIELRVIYSRQEESVSVNILGQDVTREKQQEDSRRQAMEDRSYIISSLSNLFFCTYYVDLEQDTFRTVTQLRRVGDILGPEVNCTAALQIYANNFIHPDDRAEYLRVMSIPNLVQSLRWWQPYVAMEYRQMPDDPHAGPDDWDWVRATVVLARTVENDMPKTAVYVAQNITHGKHAARD